jgi:Uma2 family endonuclease
MVTTRTITTAQQLLEAGDIGRCELVRGHLIMMTPASSEHGRIIARLTVRLGSFAERHRLGAVFGAETGFLIERRPDTVRAPDVAFVKASRLPGPKRGWFEGAPDLAVEVVSPDDRASELVAKAQMWLDAGAAIVWLVDPQTQMVTVYRPGGVAQVLRHTDVLTGHDLLPGFSVQIADIFAE